MKLTVEDVIHFPEFANLRLIAGEGGLSRTVEKCGILDYEFVPEVKEKWYSTNFRDEDMLVMTSFLYAKDNEYLIMDAVKNLVARKCSGLIIKNIFRLHVHENVIRYADMMNFPILLIGGSDIHFEDLIVLITDRVKHYGLLHYRESKVDEILRSGGDHELCARLSYDVNPSFKTDMIALYFKAPGEFTAQEYLRAENAASGRNLFATTDSMFYYKNGFFIVHSREMFAEADAKKLCAPFIEALGEKKENFRIGVSSVHHLPWQIKNCFEESLYAASLSDYGADGPAFYEDLGIYKVVLPYCRDEVMRDFCRRYLKPLADYDLENKASLVKTAVSYVQNGGSIQRTAEALSQHKNTIRYRLKSIGGITGLSVLAPCGYEVLSFAVRIYICNDRSL